MTAYGPPGTPPPPPPPGSYGPPPPGSYGPPSNYGSPKRGFDPKSVDPLDWGIFGATVLAFIFSFFSYYSYAPAGQFKDACRASGVGDVCNGIGNSAWNGFFGWFGVFLAILGAIAVAAAIFAPHVRLPFPGRLIGLGLFVLALIFTLIALGVTPDGSYQGTTIPAGSSEVDAGVGWSYWIVLIMIIIAGALCFLRFQRTGGVLPGLGGRSSGSGGHPGAPAGYGTSQPDYGAPQPGYGASQPGYGAPQGGYGSAPGYGQPPQTPPPGYGTPPSTPPPAGPPPGYSPPPGYTPPPEQNP